MLADLALVFCGGGAGASLRYVVSESVAKKGLSPWGTAAVNITGSALLGGPHLFIFHFCSLVSVVMTR